MYNSNESSEYARDMLTSVTSEKCFPRTCMNLQEPGINLSHDSMHTKKCVAESDCIREKVLDYATKDILQRMSQSEQIPVGTDILVSDSAEIVRDKLQSRVTQNNVHHTRGLPINLMYDKNGKLDVNRFGNAETDSFVKNVIEVVMATPTEKPKNYYPFALSSIVVLSSLIVYYKLSHPY